jgi:multidrug resistance efflux pump
MVLPAAVLLAMTSNARLAPADSPAQAPSTTSATTAPAAPATSPATAPSTAPSTAPTSAPVPQPAPNPNLHPVQRGNLSLDVQGEGLFQPVDPYEVRISFKAYPNPLTITKIIPPGSLVRKGDVLIEFDPTALEWGLKAAESELASAKASLAKTEADGPLAEQMDAFSLRTLEDGAKNADAAIKWWNEVDGPHMLETVDLQVKQAQHAMEDQADELDQLHKMYKDEELTSATADIVVKRAVRALEQSKISLKMQQERSEKIKAFDYPIEMAKVTDAAQQAHQQLDAAIINLKMSAASRKATLVSARLGVEEATRRLNDMKDDAEQFSVKSPVDGAVVYGQMVDGVWAGGEAKGLKPGEKIAPGGILMRVFTPGKMMVRLPLPDSQDFWVEQGMKAKVVPVALPQISYQATCGQPEPFAHPNPQPFAFEAPLILPEVDRRIIPGMKAAVHIQAGKLENVLLIPVGAVTAGKVTVQKDGHDEERDVVLGKCDGQNVEVRNGLSEGEQILMPGGKK